MNTQKQNALAAKKHNEPLFASPWIALFVILRRELTQALSDK